VYAVERLGKYWILCSRNGKHLVPKNSPYFETGLSKPNISNSGVPRTNSFSFYIHKTFTTYYQITIKLIQLQKMGLTSGSETPENR
jgi:hypothetical protein